jgi:adenylate cyclase
MAERNAGQQRARRIEFRIGINLGDIVVEGDDILGDGVNIAARIEALAAPGGVCLADDAFRQVRGKVDAEFVDIGEQQLKNIARPVRVYRAELGSRASGPHAGGTPAVQAASVLPPLPDKPSIAVLPFQNLSGDPEQEYFADGMVEEIITALSRIRWLFVIARNSSFTYRGQAPDAKRVGRELGVRYVVEGSVRRLSGRVRIAAQLIEAETGEQLWADRFDGSVAEVFDVQDEVALAVAGAIEPTLQAAEIRRSATRPTGDLTAYDLYLRALASAASFGREQRVHALDLLAQALAREPRYAQALALAASCRVDLENYDWADDPESNRRIAIDLARAALQVGAHDPCVLSRAALSLGRFGEDIEAAIGLIDRALTLNPSYADGWYWSGWLRLFAGDADLGIRHFETSLRLNPRDQRGFHFSGIGTAAFLNRRFDEAASTLRVALEELPSFTPTYRTLAACFAHMGRLDEARAIVARLRSLTPVLLAARQPFRDPEHAALFRSGLRLAAGETA